MSENKISKNDTSISGEYYMAHILAKYGFKVSMTLGRMEGFDLFVQNPQGKNLTISVKTTYSDKSKFLIMNEKAEKLIDDSLFYAFVRLNMPDGVPEFWIVPSTIVAPVIKREHEIHMKKTYKSGKPHKESPMRNFYLQGQSNYPDDWEEQLKGFKSNVKSLI
ncbi:hypothetical protein ES708_23656 [subsurface metagenome]